MGFRAGVAEFAAISAVAGCLSFLVLASRSMRWAAVLPGALAGLGGYATAVLLGAAVAFGAGLRLRYELMFFLVILGAHPGLPP